MSARHSRAPGKTRQRIVIRKYQTEDLEDVLMAWAAASAVAHPFLSDEFLAVERHNIANDVSSQCGDLGLGIRRPRRRLHLPGGQ